MAKKKKVNPHRIPLPKNAFNKDAIIEAAMIDDMTHAWLLVAEPLLEEGYDLVHLAETVYDYIKSGGKRTYLDYHLRRAHEILNIPLVSLETDWVKSSVDIEAYKRRVDRAVLDNALCIVYLGLEKTVDKEALQKVFFCADLTRAELEHGLTSFEELRKGLLEKGSTIDTIDSEL